MIDPHVPEPEVQDHILSNKLYDRLNFAAQIALPALGTLYFTLAGIWGLPFAEEVVGTIVAVDAFLGVFLRISTKSYDNSNAKYDGTVDILYINPHQKTFTFNLDKTKDVDRIENANVVTFKVNPPTV